MTPINIASAFKKPEIFPFDRHIFSDDDFLPSMVTERSMPQLEVSTPSSSTEPRISTPEFISPEDIRPYPRKKQPKTTAHTPTRRRRRGKPMIATDTPEKEELAQRKSNKQKNTKKEKGRKRLFQEVGDSDIGLHESSPPTYEGSSDSDASLLESESDFLLEQESEINDYVLVEFKDEKGRGKVYYCGKVVEEVSQDEFNVHFLRKSQKYMGKFIFPNDCDMSIVQKDDIKLLLPQPQNWGSTKRQKSFLSFSVNLDSFNVR